MLSCGDTESGEYSVYAGFRESNDLINTRKGKQNSVRMNVNIVECAFYVRRLLPDTELAEYIIQFFLVCDFASDFSQIMKAAFNIQCQ
jgi:hypothetical protein